MYSIIDIETTGGSPAKEKITEIAIFVHDGQKVVDEYVTLINPEKNIPYFISQLTGINNEMVADAPKFYEVAAEILKRTENTIFIAHNVSFDYGFIKNEFKELGYDFNRERLCTVKLSRKLIPGKKSYSLGNLCKDLGIVINDRHRAAGDALATVKLFELLLKCNGAENPISIYNINEDKIKSLSSSVDKEFLRDLPEKTGVYYFYNYNKEIIYVGKSKNIKARVMQHFNNANSKKAIEMKNAINDISVELTGSELVALLLESDEIKKNKPKYNRAQRRTMSSSGLYRFTNEKGYDCLKIGKIDKNTDPVTTFASAADGKDFINNLIDKYNLCQKLCGVYETENACFFYHIKQCRGACVGEESPDSYNKRVNQALESLHFSNDNFIIFDKGRKEGEKSVVLVENGNYKGFGFFDVSESFSSVDAIRDCITNYSDNSDIRQIIKLFLRKNRVEKVIHF